MEVNKINLTVSTEKIRERVMDGKEMRILPAEVWNSFSKEEVQKLLWETGTYVIPTEELISFLDKEIGQERTIEIGAGNGWVGRELGILMTDSYQQKDDKKTVLMYAITGQPTIKYPKDVIKLDAITAVKRYRPYNTVACYVTHKFRYDTQDGNYLGVDFEKLIQYTRKLILVGNLKTHKNNPLMQKEHRVVYFPGLLTRANDPETNRIFIWER